MDVTANIPNDFFGPLSHTLKAQSILTFLFPMSNFRHITRNQISSPVMHKSLPSKKWTLRIMHTTRNKIIRTPSVSYGQQETRLCQSDHYLNRKETLDVHSIKIDLTHPHKSQCFRCTSKFLYERSRGRRGGDERTPIDT